MCNRTCPTCCASFYQKAMRPSPTPRDDFVHSRMQEEYAKIGNRFAGMSIVDVAGMSTVGFVDVDPIPGEPDCDQCSGVGAWICDSCEKGRIADGPCLPCSDRGCAACLCTACDGSGGESPCSCVLRGVLAVPA